MNIDAKNEKNTLKIILPEESAGVGEQSLVVEPNNLETVVRLGLLNDKGDKLSFMLETRLKVQSKIYPLMWLEVNLDEDSKVFLTYTLRKGYKQATIPNLKEPLYTDEPSQWDDGESLGLEKPLRLRLVGSDFTKHLYKEKLHHALFEWRCTHYHTFKSALVKLFSRATFGKEVNEFPSYQSLSLSGAGGKVNSTVMSYLLLEAFGVPIRAIPDNAYYLKNCEEGDPVRKGFKSLQIFKPSIALHDWIHTTAQPREAVGLILTFSKEAFKRKEAEALEIQLGSGIRRVDVKDGAVSSFNKALQILKVPPLEASESMHSITYSIID